MKILLSQYRPAIRLYKWADTLEKMGHSITILHTNEPITNIDFNRFNIIQFSKGYDYAKDYDLHISFNTNIRALSLLDLPTIQAVGDLKGYYTEKYKAIELQAMKQAIKCVFVSEFQMKEALKFYPFIKGKCLVIYNGIIEEQKQNCNLLRLHNGKTNIVYSGTISDKEANHRYFMDIFKYLASLKSVQFHVYPSNLGLPECYENIENIIYHEPCSPFELIKRLTVYDIGLIYYEGSSDVADSSLPNKLYEYLQAGLPILSGDYKSLKKFNKGKDVIIFFKDFKEIENLLSIKRPKENHTITYENQIKKINKLIN